MIKISIFVLHLGYGGIEKFVSNFVNMLVDNYDIEIISLYKLYDNPAFYIDDRVKIRYLLNEKMVPNKTKFLTELKRVNLFGIFKEGFKACKILYDKKMLIKKNLKETESDIVITTRIDFSLQMAKTKKKYIKIAQEHVHHHDDVKYLNKIKKICNNIDFLMPSSNYLTDYYKEKILDSKAKIIWLKMPIDNTCLNQKSLLSAKNIISVGRLSKEKGFTDLIDIFSKVNKVHPDWKLNIIGNGPEYNKLSEQVQNLKLSKVVKLYGFQKQEYINELYCNSSIYVMTSFEESFGLVLLESGRFGLPIVAFDSALGAKEIIGDNEYGILVPKRDKDKMVEKINTLIENKCLREKYASRIIEKSKRYNFNNIKEYYLVLFDKIINEYNNVNIPKNNYDIKESYSTFFNKIEKYFNKIKRDGFINATKKALIKFNTDYLSNFNIYQKSIFLKNKNELELLLQEILKGNFDRILIWRSSIGWNIPLFQRPQHLCNQLAEKKCLIFYEVTRMTENINYIEKKKENLYLIDFESIDFRKMFFKVLSKQTKPKYIFFSSTCWDLSNNQVINFVKSGYKILYDYLDHLSPELVGTDKLPQNIVKNFNYICTNINDSFVLTTADLLYDDIIKKRKSNKNVLHVTNGVDINHFQNLNQNVVLDKYFVKILDKKKPIIGYYGAIASWFDYDLIKKLAYERPNYEIVIMGAKYDSSLDKQNFSKFSNIHFLSPKSFNELPYYAKHFNICILPFLINDITKSTNPIKIFEYMALEKPIITTNLIECRNYKSVNIANDYDKFINLCDKFIKNVSTSYINQLKNDALNNTWQEKAQEIVKALKKFEKK